MAKSKYITKEKLKQFLLPGIVFILVIGLWESIVYLFSVPNYLVATPHQIALYIRLNIKELLTQSGITFLEATLGFLVGGGIGIIVGVLFANFRWVKISFYPYVIALKTMPVIALAPLLVIWFGGGVYSRAAIAGIICFFPCLVNTVRGLQSVEDDWLDIVYSMGASRWQLFYKVRLKFALPYILAGLKISTTLSVIGAVVAEFIVFSSGVGFTILYARTQHDMPAMSAGILASALIGMLMFGIMSLIEKKTLYWFGSKIEAET
jgi:NitT/TauT family transport system permease protein